MNDFIRRKAALDTPVRMVSEGLDWIPVYHIKNLPSAWILCSERLPETGQEVLIWYYNRPYIAWHDGEEWRTDDFSIGADERPLAWFPLPEPYEGEQHE